MKKLHVLISVLVISLSLGITAMAQGKKANRAKQNCCSTCDKSAATPETLKKFKLGSLELRRDMMNKRFDLQRETLQETPDSAKVAAIKADMDAIKTKIDALKTEAMLPVTSSCCNEDCPLMDGGCGSCGAGKACAKNAGNFAQCGMVADCCCLKGGKDCPCDSDCECAKCKKAKKSTKPAGCRNCNKSR